MDIRILGESYHFIPKVWKVGAPVCYSDLRICWKWEWSRFVRFFPSSKIRTSWINSSTNTPVCFAWRCLCVHLGREVSHRQSHSHGSGFPFVCWSEGQQKQGWIQNGRAINKYQQITMDIMAKKWIKRVIAMPRDAKRVGPSSCRSQKSLKGTQVSKAWWIHC